MTSGSDEGGIRLNQYLAQLGVASRRACDDIIAAGRVKIDGRIVRELGTRVVPSRQSILLDGHAVGKPPRRLVFLMHKPRGYVSTVSDPEGRPTVIDLCKSLARRQRLFPVGRLDVNTTGALLITNDGDLCYRLTHPRFGIARVYQVRVRGDVSDSQLRRLLRLAQEGVRDRERPRATRPNVEVVTQLEKEAVLKVTLLEGRNRQVRLMCEAVGLRVVALKRLSFGPVSVRKLPLGAIRPLERRELERLDALTKGNVR
ncbi:MAG TPA: pseudouridine synthase [Candidatus Krumholzibacteria bacterium]|nr:pseudouridine synthase [Candidatus Krumholzibacteria bacterium]